MRLLGRRAECGFLDAALADARDGRSRVVVLRGEAGAGKSTLLDFVVEQADGWRVASAVGIESEMELAYSGLHQLCAPMVDRLDRLPAPQHDALGTIFGLRAGEAPDRFLVALATLSLLAEVAEQQPLLCVIDDAQWLDAASAQILVFVGRRFLAERIAVVCAARTEIGSHVLDGLPELRLKGLDDSDGRALLLENLQGPLDAAVCDQIVSESHGNPLALLELPRSWNIADLAGGFGLPARHPVVSRIEQSYAKRLLLLPLETQLLVLAAAAEPLGDLVVLQRAAEILGVGIAAAVPAVNAGLLDVSGHVEFAHPLVRSAAYSSAGLEERQRVHRALAEATDPVQDADRRAWHRARGAPRHDEEVAAELERSATRAQARGGVAAAAAFLERAAALSPGTPERARRALAAADAKHVAGAPQAALKLLVTATDGPLDETAIAVAQRLRGQIAHELRRGAEAVPLLLEAARLLEPLQPDLARTTYLDALRAGNICGRLGGDVLRRAAEAARNAPRPTGAPRAVDLQLDALAVRCTDGYAAGATPLKRALDAARQADGAGEEDMHWPWFGRRIALDLFDADMCRALASRSVELARERGALGVLPLALGSLATTHTVDGRFDAAEGVLDESDAITDAIGASRIGSGRLLLAGLRGDEAALSRLAATARAEAMARGEGLVLTFVEHALAVLYNGLGRYESALPMAESASAGDELGVSARALPELVEAAARCGRADTAADALERLTERTQAAGTEWALGIEARSRALLADGTAAEELYREAVDRLARSGIAPERARAHLLFGERLRRDGRRSDARDQLRTAHDLLAGFGMSAFAERARRELTATGGKPRQRSAETRDDLTAQEAQIAGLARDGYTNPEIGAQLFLSSRTIEWHMRKVFAKLGIRSRRELDAALAAQARAGSPV
jgi:DNA-binding CsgD family transcriptional regulator